MRRAFERQVGAHDFSFDLETGVGTLAIDPSEDLNLSGLQQAITDAGFEFAMTEVSVVGTITRVADPTRKEALLLRRQPSGQQVWLVPGDAEETRQTFTELGRWADDRVVMRIRGRAHVHADGSVAVQVRAFESMTPNY